MELFCCSSQQAFEEDCCFGPEPPEADQEDGNVTGSNLPSLEISSWTEFGPVTQIKKLLVRGVEIESSSIGTHDAKSFQHHPLLEWSPQHVIRPMLKFFGG